VGDASNTPEHFQLIVIKSLKTIGGFIHPFPMWQAVTASESIFRTYTIFTNKKKVETFQNFS